MKFKKCLKKNKESILCPSAQCDEGAILLGVVQKNGHISFVRDKVFIDDEFVRISHLGRSPEKRFRFANTCAKAACKHWRNHQCMVVDTIVDICSPQPEMPRLPQCSIRENCRWFKQSGRKACTLCPLIITDLHIEEQT